MNINYRWTEGEISLIFIVMKESSHSLKSWMAAPLLPLMLLLAFIASVWPGKKTVDRTPEDVAKFIEDFLDGTGGDWDWDDFESVAITDPKLDALRQEAVMVGPPYHSEEKLRSILARARALVPERSGERVIP